MNKTKGEPMSDVVLKIKKLHQEAIIPEYQSKGAAGFDFCALESCVIKAGKYFAVSTGIALEIQEGFEVQVRPRSGLALKNGISVLNTPGTIDNDYRGEIKVLLVNHSDNDFSVQKGDRIAQGVLNKVYKASFQEVSTLSQTQRAERGFGSSGMQENTH